MDRPTGPGLLPVPNETSSSTTRITRDNKTLRYDLCVLQQPERARACGAGLKGRSSSFHHPKSTTDATMTAHSKHPPHR